jgi:O-antigen/teichoic acid export membrane protein
MPMAASRCATSPLRGFGCGAGFDRDDVEGVGANGENRGGAGAASAASGRTEARAIATGVSSVLGARLLSAFASLLAQILIARWLGPAGNGILASAMSILAMGMLFADLSLNASISRLLAAAYYAAPERVPAIVRAGAFAKALLTLSVGTVMVLGAGRFAEVLNGPVALVPVLVMAGAQLVLDNAATFSFRGLQGLHLPRQQALAQAISGIGTPIVSLVLVAMVMGYLPLPGAEALARLMGEETGDAGAGAAATVLGRAVAAGVAALWGAAALARAVRLARSAAPAGARGSVATRPFREITGFASKLVWVQLAYVVVFRLDIALVQFFLGEQVTGLYAVPAQVGERIMLPAASLAVVVAPYFAAMNDPARRPFLGRLLHRSMRLLTLLYLPAAVGLAALAPDAIRLVFGSAYDPSVPLVRAYAVAIPVVAFASLLGQILDYAGLARTRALAFLAAAAVDVALNTVLIPRLGAVGAIVALVLSFAPLLAVYAVTLGRRVGVRARVHLADLARAALASAVMGALVLAARPDMPGGGGALRLVGLVALGAATYAVVLWAIGGVDRDELANLRGLLGRGRRGESREPAGQD